MPIDVDAAYRRYGPLVRRRCEQMLRDPEEARDAMHDAFVRLARRRDDYEPHALGGLLYRIATSVCLNHLRTRRRRPEDRDQELLMRIANTEDPAAQGLARHWLDRIFARESESSKTIAVLHYVDGMTLEEVAREVGLSVSGVRFKLRELKLHVDADLEAV